eukprot:CAMPEP_0194204402 /NCGR_PEP_ID=MMETSP0156-20130528/3930_1 /TAXON_ID=33649 /ORGANISM="Thalassionema nitzschioides, Strain L26-B" /LENGTH=273 /DNA_ID=CAMNT_0038930401 /DNA_START=126 /DNA_END=944 /DNA_ORIENTATION=+
MSSYQPITPAFAWAHPEFNSLNGRKDEAVKAVSNPLMHRTPIIATQETTKKSINSDLSKNDSEVELLSSTSSNNSSLRQRRKPNNENAMILPPTKSLTEGFLNGAIECKDLKKKYDSEIVIWSNTADSSRNVPEKTIMDFWILIYGFSSVDHFAEIMRRFSEFGTITNQRSGRSNWVAIKYKSSLEVEKALCQKPCFLSDGSVIGVCRMNEDLRDSLDWKNSTDNSGAQGKSCLVAVKDEDLYLADPRQHPKATSICERLLSILFGWEENNNW